MPILADKTDIAKQLKELNKSYYNDQQIRDMFVDTAIAEQQAISSLKYDYAQDINDAYISSLQNRQYIYDSALGQGYKQQFIQQNQSDLQTAFERYRNNYMTNISSVAENISDTQADIVSIYQNQQKGLENQADKINNYFDAHFDYLTKLYENNPELFDASLFDDAFMSNDVDGRRIKTKHELMKPSVDKEGSDGGFYYTDEQGNQYITDYGVNMLSILESVGLYDEAKGYSFGSYLEEADKNLWEWASAMNNEYGMSNADLFRKLSGVTDYIPKDNRLYDYHIRDIGSKWENEYVNITADNLINTDFMDENAISKLEDKQWKLDTNNSYTISKFIDTIKDNKYDDEDREFIEGIENGTIKQGTIVDLDYGSGQDFYVYWNGMIYPLISGTNKEK